MWLSGLNASLWTTGLPVWFQVRAHAWVVGQDPSRGHGRGNHTLMFLSLSFSLPSPLSKNKINKILKKINTFKIGLIAKKHWYMLQRNWTRKHGVRGKKPDTKGHIMYDPIYVKCPKQAHPRRREVDQRLPGAREAGGGQWLLVGTGFYLRGVNRFWNQTVMMVAQPCECVKCTI